MIRITAQSSQNANHNFVVVRSIALSSVRIDHQPRDSCEGTARRSTSRQIPRLVAETGANHLGRIRSTRQESCVMRIGVAAKPGKIPTSRPRGGGRQSFRTPRLAIVLSPPFRALVPAYNARAGVQAPRRCGLAASRFRRSTPTPSRDLPAAYPCVTERPDGDALWRSGPGSPPRRGRRPGLSTIAARSCAAPRLAPSARRKPSCTRPHHRHRHSL
jgi:hypothetical protein